jgi:hypothetical protein
MLFSYDASWNTICNTAWMPIVHSQLELNFLCGTNRGLVQPLTETLHDFHDSNLSVCGEHGIEPGLRRSTLSSRPSSV